IALDHFPVGGEGWSAEILPIDVDRVPGNLIAADKVKVGIAVQTVGSEIKMDHAFLWNILNHPAIGAEVQAPDLLGRNVKSYVNAVERARRRWPGYTVAGDGV